MLTGVLVFISIVSRFRFQFRRPNVKTDEAEWPESEAIAFPARLVLEEELRSECGRPSGAALAGAREQTSERFAILRNGCKRKMTSGNLFRVCVCVTSGADEATTASRGSRAAREAQRDRHFRDDSPSTAERQRIEPRNVPKPIVCVSSRL